MAYLSWVELTEDFAQSTECRLQNNPSVFTNGESPLVTDNCRHSNTTNQQSGMDI